MALLKKFKKILIDNFVIIKDLKSTRKELRDIKFMLSIMMDHYWETADKARPATGAVRQKQLVLLDMLNDLVSVLNKYNIKYWLDYGTLLGAVRHKGFIPWDDDLDIGVLHSDRKLILESVKSELSDKYSIYYFGEHDKFLKFEKYYGNNKVSIDLFPYKSINKIMETKFFPEGVVYNNPFPEDAIFPLKILTFESTEYSVPNKFNLYLKKNYGEYMSLPKSSHYWSHEKWDSYHNFYPGE